MEIFFSIELIDSSTSLLWAPSSRISIPYGRPGWPSVAERCCIPASGGSPASLCQHKSCPPGRWDLIFCWGEGLKASFSSITCVGLGAVFQAPHCMHPFFSFLEKCAASKSFMDDGDPFKCLHSCPSEFLSTRFDGPHGALGWCFFVILHQVSYLDSDVGQLSLSGLRSQASSLQPAILGNTGLDKTSVKLKLRNLYNLSISKYTTQIIVSIVTNICN